MKSEQLIEVQDTIQLLLGGNDTAGRALTHGVAALEIASSHGSKHVPYTTYPNP
jgi:hypothetical protein